MTTTMEQTYNQFYNVKARNKDVYYVLYITKRRLNQYHRIFQKLANEFDLNALKATQVSSPKAQSRLFKRLVNDISEFDLTNSDKLMNVLVSLDMSQNKVARDFFIKQMGDYLFDLIPGYCIEGQHMHMHVFKNIDLHVGTVRPDSQKSQRQAIAFDYFYNAIFQTLALLA